MLRDFYIVHRRKPSLFDAQGAPLWSTCLRHVAFVAPGFVHTDADEVFAEQDAYKFLLEVVCGLQSPVWGETEVFGQFKEFSQQWVQTEPRRQTLVQKILNDAKAIRTQYLRHLGTQSYGGWVRKHLRSPQVHVLGGGILTREILPYLQKLKVEIVLHVRSPGKIDFFDGPVMNIKDGKFTGGAVIVAAPLSAAEIASWLGHSVAPTQLFDMRDDSATAPVQVSSATQAFLLRDIFAQIEKTKALLVPRLAQVQREISSRSARAAEKSLLRPLGWDDLCA
jgi:glutamyl-tRNA reductase